MQFLITFIVLIIFNYIVNYIIKKIKEFIQIIKLKKTTKDLDRFNIEDFNINKEFWDDLDEEDIEEK